MPSSISDINKTIHGVNPVAAVATLPAMATVQTITVPDEANLLLIQVDTQAVRLTFDGTNPTTTYGWLFRSTTASTTDRKWIPIPPGTTAMKVLETAASATGLYQFYKTTQNFPFN